MLLVKHAQANGRLHGGRCKSNDLN